MGAVIGFLGILRAGEMEFLAGGYVGDGGRGSPFRTLISSLGDDIGNSRGPIGRPRGAELAPVGDIEGCKEDVEVFALGS